MNHILSHTLEEIKRNWKLCVLTMVVVAGLFTIFNLLSFEYFMSKNLISTFQKKMSFTIYLKENIDAFSLRQLIDDIEKSDLVLKPIIYTSSEEAKQNLNIIKTYNIKLPASLTITPKKLEYEQSIRNFLSRHPKKSYIISTDKLQKEQEEKIYQKLKENLNRFKNLASGTLFFIVFIFAVISTIIIFATLKLGMHLKKHELIIMKFVGAPSKLIKLPYIFEGMIYSVIGCVIGAAVFLILHKIYYANDPFLVESFKLFPLKLVFFLEFIASILIGLSGGFFAIKSLSLKK